jgi:hypothetical protein
MTAGSEGTSVALRANSDWCVWWRIRSTHFGASTWGGRARNKLYMFMQTGKQGRVWVQLTLPPLHLQGMLQGSNMYNTVKAPLSKTSLCVLLLRPHELPLLPDEPQGYAGKMQRQAKHTGRPAGACSRRPRGTAPSCARPDAPTITRCIPLQPHMALPFTSATASSWYACRRKVARSGRFSEKLTASKCSSTLHLGVAARPYAKHH